MRRGESTFIRYRIDARQSSFLVHAFSDGLLSIFGHNPTVAVCGFGGDVRFVRGTLEGASLLMLVKADSLSVIGKVGETDRLEMERAIREEVLETAHYPEILFVSKDVSVNQIREGKYETRIDGSLSMHGVTRDELIFADVTIDGGDMRARGGFTLRQSDYNIKPASAVGGALRVKDELKLSFDIAAYQREL